MCAVPKEKHDIYAEFWKNKLEKGEQHMIAQKTPKATKKNSNIIIHIDYVNNIRKEIPLLARISQRKVDKPIISSSKKKKRGK